MTILKKVSTRRKTLPIARIPAVEVFPVIENGRLASKATVGEPFPISATVFREGHDAYGAEAVLFTPKGRVFSRTRMNDVSPGNDRYEAWVMVDEPGNWSFRIETWSDPYRTWQHDASIKIHAGIDVELMLEEGAMLMERIAEGRALGAGRAKKIPAAERTILTATAAELRDTSLSDQRRLSAGVSSQVRQIILEYPLRDLLDHTVKYPLYVSRERALCGSWYEIFPRSCGALQNLDGSWKSGTLREAAQELPRISGMGFDVIYLTPIHPIGTSFRKGKNNNLVAGPSDPGSPWGIGSEDGGHEAIHKDLGTMDDFRAFVKKAHDEGMEVAMDLALQCSRDHPWIKEHPEWFARKSNGEIAYAENPPKKYQDIYPLFFDQDPDGLKTAIKEVVEQWISEGVTIFRVDNPHTKPLTFWYTFLSEMHQEHPDIIFLAEAFTRPAMMRTLGSIGFDLSYTYFTWRTYKQEIIDYLQELSSTTAHQLRPAFWPTTPDILTEQMTTGGTTIFAIRAFLAALGAPTWGIYSGYELAENEQRPGFEESNNNEKYEYRPRDWSKGEETGIPQLLTILNAIRKNHPALRQLHQLSIHGTSHPDVLCFSRHIDGKFTASGHPDTVIVVLSLNPLNGANSTVDLDLSAIGGSALGEEFTVTDELDGQSYKWGTHNWVELSPWTRIAHVFTVSYPNEIDV